MFGKELLVRESCPDPEQNSSAWDCSQDNKTTADKEHGASVGLTLLPEKKTFSHLIWPLHKHREELCLIPRELAKSVLL